MIQAFKPNYLISRLVGCTGPHYCLHGLFLSDRLCIYKLSDQTRTELKAKLVLCETEFFQAWRGLTQDSYLAQLLTLCVLYQAILEGQVYYLGKLFGSNLTYQMLDEKWLHVEALNIDRGKQLFPTRTASGRLLSR